MHPDRNPQGLVPCGFLRLGLDERGDRDAGTKTQNGRRGAPQDVDWRMAEPLRRRSARGLRELTRSFVMTGEVRLFGKGALNSPGAAAMAAGAAAGDHPPTMDRWGQYARNPSSGQTGEGPRCIRASPVAGNVAGAAAASHAPSKMDRADKCEDRVPENRLLVSLAQARALSGGQSGTLLPGPEGERRGPGARWWSGDEVGEVGEVGEGPEFVRVSVIVGLRGLGPVLRACVARPFEATCRNADGGPASDCARQS
jgi:hypothetical protein